jgi:uncharacterized membrane protein YeaQ/YmgE (transglycosylase-associated protein family)
VYDGLRRGERKLSINSRRHLRGLAWVADFDYSWLSCTRAEPRRGFTRPNWESAMFSVDQVIVWIVVGLLGGALAGALMTWDRSGYGLWRNLALGLAGAIIGGLLFRIFGIWPGLDKIAISLRDIVSAVVGSLLVLAALWLWRKFGTSRENT